MPEPNDYAATLLKLTEADSDLKDRYGKGGAVERLEHQFATLTRKERALYLPSGTMANQLAIRVLSDDASKVLVQDLSHVFRDEADAAQVVHGKRLVPLAPGRACFTAQELEETVHRLRRGEVFRTRIGALSIENPVRRAEGEVFDIAELRRVCEFARANDIGLHLDGARLLIASEYSGVGVDEYAALFDTVYISLYKYLRAPAGAVLCGPAAVIDRAALLRKMHGGDMYQNWPYAAVALHFMDGFADRFAQARAKADSLFEALEATGRFEVHPIPNGSNIFRLGIGDADIEQFRQRLREKWVLSVGGAQDDGFIRLHVNETQLEVSNEVLAEAFEDAHRAASKDFKGGRS
jgi:threonine aldolase